MTMLEGIDFNNVPDKILPVAPGIKILRIEDAPQVNAEDHRVNIVLKVDMPGDPDHGREVYDNPDFTHPVGKVSIRRLALSANVSFGANGALNFSDFIGRKVCALIVHNQEKKPQPGMPPKIYANVQYLIPGDQGYRIE